MKNILNKISGIRRLIKKNGKPDGVTSFGKNVTVGKEVSFGGNVFLFKTAPITIGDHTMIAYNVTIHTSTHNYNKHPMRSERIDRPVKIGKHVWIGTGAIILPGVIIEDYAVVGAGAIVTKNVPEGAVVAGNPAKIIKFRDMKNINFNTKILDNQIGNIIKGDFINEYVDKIT